MEGGHSILNRHDCSQKQKTKRRKKTVLVELKEPFKHLCNLVNPSFGG